MYNLILSSNLTVNLIAGVQELGHSPQLTQNPQCPLDSMVPRDTTPHKLPSSTAQHLREIVGFGWRRLSQMRGTHYKVPSSAQRVPTFYAVPHRINVIPASNLVISIIGVMFGAIHCTGWNLIFPTRAEKIIWRTAAVLIFAFPILMVLHASLIMIGGIPRFLSGLRLKGIMVIGEIFWKCLPIYFFGRMILLVEAFVTLRGLPEEAFLQVEWTRFLPHI